MNEVLRIIVRHDGGGDFDSEVRVSTNDVDDMFSALEGVIETVGEYVRDTLDSNNAGNDVENVVRMRILYAVKKCMDYITGEEEG